MLTYDPVPWLMAQEGLSAVRARRLLGLCREGDEQAVDLLQQELSKAQLRDGSFEQSPMKTAGVLNLLSDSKGGRLEGPDRRGRVVPHLGPQIATGLRTGEDTTTLVAARAVGSASECRTVP